MTVKRLLAIGFIMICTATAWFLLGSTLTWRTRSTHQRLEREVTGNWGTPMTQVHPTIYYLSRWLSSPIRKLTEYARAVRRGERVPLPRLSSPDAKTLGRALEEMRDSLEGRKYVESYVQTLTHEMKSPVAAIRGAAELLEEEGMPAEQRRKFLDNIRTETERLQNSVDRLLALSVIESKKSLENPEEIAVAELIDDLCAAHQHAFETRQIRLRKDYVGTPVLRGEAFLLETALGNLLQNAIDFSPNGATITVAVREDREGQCVEIVFEDEGPGIPDYARDRVFDRFYSLRRPGTGRKSSGLGLCFVREAAQLHGGTATLENRSDGTGARAVLSLPHGTQGSAPKN